MPGETTDGSDELGRAFAAALAEKDVAGLTALLAPDVSFRGLTPGRSWSADSAGEVVAEILLGAWFEPSDTIEELVDVQTGQVEDTQRVSYRLHVRTPDGSYTVEQQAYYRVSDRQITWLRSLLRLPAEVAHRVESVHILG